MSNLPGADVPMTTEELRDTLAQVINGHSRKDKTDWDLNLAMSAVEAHVALRTASLREELAEAKRDADRGWKAAEDEQEATQEWATTAKRLMAHNDALQAALSATRRSPQSQPTVCGAVAVTTSGLLGPCTVGWHHESFPHQDASGTRWQTLALPASAEPDDLTQRLAAAYHLRFENDGHPEDSRIAAEVAMTILGPELDRLRQEKAEQTPPTEGDQMT